MNAPAPRMGQPVRLAAGDWLLDGMLRQDDVATVSNWMASPRIAYVLGRSVAPPNHQRTLGYFQTFDRISSHLLIVRRREDGRAEGLVAIRMDGRHLVADVDVIVGSATTRLRDGQTLLQVAGDAVAAWVFDVVGMRKIMARVLRRNRRTVAWAERHLILEGTLRDHARLPDGSRETVLQFGLLAEEWRSRKAVPFSAHATVDVP